MVKWLLGGVAIAAILGGLYLMQSGIMPATSGSEDQGTTPGFSGNLDRLPDGSMPSAEAGQAPMMSEATRRELAAEKQDRIQELMREFAEVRFDDDERNRVQAEIDGLMAEYNKLILPVAVSQMKTEAAQR